MSEPTGLKRKYPNQDIGLGTDSGVCREL
ncbi:hypothetical protein BWQ96_00267 [Gracilariopsis chorda]|uniref:Uncharacterized protein n=1 Tax=Gracilariopsis chorda TaxID=448386 RepID=A0A2V3J8X8_9FLOR|nr:hypothetical protein BWQ96_00267 [Gracilariopsis chorda]|eukprot:PXF50107.1 hypothetical protein BWQ96_00267 [Gracilariopsis chorda]